MLGAGWAVLVLLAAAASASAAPLPAKNSRGCYEWIAPFFDFLTLKEGRDMRRSDLIRFFSYMDTSVNGMVSIGEFEAPWQASTQMTQADTRRIFARWAIMKEKQDPTHITRPNQNGIWVSWDPVKGEDTVTRDSFNRAMEEILPTLPNRGCPDRDFHNFD